MPQVPVYGGTQVRTAPLQTVQQGQIDVSSGMRALSQATGQIAGEIDKFTRREAETQANTVDTEITAGWLQWDAENRRKYQGQNVGEYETAANEWWDKARQQYGANLNPLAQQAVGPAIARKRNQALGSVLGYVGAEKERFADQQSEAAAQTTIEFGVDTGDVAGARDRVRKIVAEKGARKGWTTDLVEAEQQRLLGTLHLTHIQQMAERNPAGANEYYLVNKKEIPAPAQRGVEKLLEAETENKAATEFASRVATLPLADQISKAADLKPEVREKALVQIRNNHAMVKAAQAENEAAASDEAWQMVGQGKRVPESTLMRMNGRERVQLQDHLRERAKQAASGESAKTDWVTYIDVREKLAAGEKVDLRPLTTKIAPAQMEQLLDIQTKRNTPGKAPEVATSEQQLSAYTRRMDLKGEKLGQFQSAAYDRFNMHLKSTGKEPTLDEREVILDQLTTEVVTSPGWIWDSKGPAYTLPKVQRDAALPATDNFTTGKVYTDKGGNRAKYLGGGKWEPVK